MRLFPPAALETESCISASRLIVGPNCKEVYGDATPGTSASGAWPLFAEAALGSLAAIDREGAV